MSKTYPWILILSLAFLVGQGCYKTSVVGNVTDIEGKPIIGARLAIIDVDSEAKPFHESETRSDADGRFSLNALPGNSRLSVYADGYASMYFIRNITRGVNRNWNFELPQSACVSGRVLDTNGKPLADRVLCFYPVKNSETIPASGVCFDGNWAVGYPTDKDGIFNIPGIAPCRHQITVIIAASTGRGMLQVPVNGEFIEVEPGECVKDLNIVVNPPEDYAISGHVRSTWGHPVSHVFVDTYQPSGEHWFTWTDNKGAFCLEGLDGMGTSSFKVTFKGNFEMTIPAVPLNSKNVELIVPRKGSIHGTVRNAKTGEPVETYQVTVPTITMPKSGAVWEKPQVKIERHTDASFSVSGIPAGEAIVEVRAADGLGAQRFATTVEEAKINLLECVMLGPSVLTGRTTRDGKPKSTRIVINGEWLHSDEDGSYRFDQYPNGDYTVWFYGWGDGWNHRSAEIQLKSGGTTRLDMEMGGSCEVRGSIIFPEETPSCMVRLAAKPAPDGWSDRGQLSPEEFVLSYAYVGRSGDAYRLRCIPPGRWHLMVGKHHRFMGRYILTLSRIVELKEGETMLLDFDLTDTEEQKNDNEQRNAL